MDSAGGQSTHPEFLFSKDIYINIIFFFFGRKVESIDQHSGLRNPVPNFISLKVNKQGKEAACRGGGRRGTGRSLSRWLAQGVPKRMGCQGRPGSPPGRHVGQGHRRSEPRELPGGSLL